MEKIFLLAQKNEITEHFIYKKLAESTSDAENKKTLNRIADDEMKHYEFWKTFTKKDMRPNRLKVLVYFLMAKFFGLTFSIRLMEKTEKLAQVNYKEIVKEIPSVAELEAEENKHEQELISMIQEEKLKYVGSMVLGLNDALTELTGALAGLTLALHDTHLIAITGGITGIAASLSMAASEYLSTKAEGSDQNPVKASVYTGIAYVVTVTILITPYLIFENYFIALGTALASAILIILFFTFYISVAKNIPFTRRFLEMVGISMGVSAVTFTIGYFIQTI